MLHKLHCFIRLISSQYLSVSSILKSVVTIALLASYTIAFPVENDTSDHSDPEVIGMQFLLPEFIPGCKSRPNIQSEDDAARLRRLDTVVENLRVWYEQKDIKALKNIFTPLESSTMLLQAIQKDAKTYNTISLTFSIDRILITQQQDFAVHLRWEGTWQAPEQKAPLRARGLSVFKFTGDQQIMLQGIDGDSPFGIDQQNAPGAST